MTVAAALMEGTPKIYHCKHSNSSVIPTNLWIALQSDFKNGYHHKKYQLARVYGS